MQQDGMTVRLVTISVKSSPTLILHEPVFMGESFYSLLPYLCSGYPRLASQELAFYHAYSGGWRNRCGIPWPLPACQAIYLLAEFHSVHIAEHWGIINVPLLCHGHLKKQQKSGPNTAFVKACKLSYLWCMVMVPSKTLHCITSGCPTNNETMSAVKEIWTMYICFCIVKSYLLTSLGCSHEIKVGSLFSKDTELYFAALTQLNTHDINHKSLSSCSSETLWLFVSAHGTLLKSGIIEHCAENLRACRLLFLQPAVLGDFFWLVTYIWCEVRIATEI